MPKGIPNKRYTGEFKQEVVETMLREKLSYKEIARLQALYPNLLTEWDSAKNSISPNTITPKSH